MSQQLTQRQIQRLGKLPPNYRIVSAKQRFPVVRSPDGQRMSVQPNGRLVAFPHIRQVQSYLHLHMEGR